MPITPDILELAHDLLATTLSDGALAVDATAGNGHDTLHLARCVGPTGHIVAFDIQPDAIHQTRRRIQEAGLADRVTLIQADHATMHEHLRYAGRPLGGPAEHPHGRPANRPSAVCFNLGYLPQGDKSVITRPDSTIPALDAAVDLLAPGGLLTIVAYSGHPGGAEERHAVVRWAEQLPRDAFQVAHYRILNRSAAPELISVEKLRAPE